MTALQKLPPEDDLLRARTLLQIDEDRPTLVADFEQGFTLHEIKDRGEVAIHPLEEPGDYLRSYVAEPVPGSFVLVIDDVVFDADEVDLTREIYWDIDLKRWESREVVERGGLT
jgi:hypothetical protein